MKDIGEIERWLHGTVRAWLVAESEQMEARLYAEAIALIWVMNSDCGWAGARAIFEEMRVALDKEMSWSHVQKRESAADGQLPS